ncbi:lipase [Bacillus paranthracis]|nr:lipase [Bacillus paranthracis]
MKKLLIGNLSYYARYEENRPLIDTVWWQNDGVVNTNSMIVSSTNTAVNNYEPLQVGRWNHIETKANWDHFDMVGLNVSDTLGFSSIQEFYRAIAEKLSRLPK